METPFFGPAYLSRSPNLADQQCINLYPELVETKGGKRVGAFYGSPGLDLIYTVGSGPIRAMHAVFGDPSKGRAALLWVVSGSTLYSVNLAGNIVNRGAIGGPGGYLYSFGTVAPGFSNIALPFSPQPTGIAASVVKIIDNGQDVAVLVGIPAAQMDGFGVIGQSGSYLMFQSALLDLSSWPAVNVFSASGDSDPIVDLAANRRQLIVLKQVHTEFWINAGTSPVTFARLDGTYLNAGCHAGGSTAQIGESLMWIGRNVEGIGVVLKLDGYTASRVSTHSIDRMFQGYPIPQASPALADCVGYSYEQEGHVFYVLTSPSGNATWVYDVTASNLAGIPMWHQRGAFANGLFSRHQGNAYALFGSKNLIGDWQVGNIYALDLDTRTDNGAQRKWLRSWRAAAQPPEKVQRFNALTIDMQTGIGVPDGTAPNVMLRWSDDGGNTWSPYMIGAAGAPGQTGLRVKFNRLGSLRRGNGNDRIFELSSADQFPPALIGAQLS